MPHTQGYPNLESHTVRNSRLPNSEFFISCVISPDFTLNENDEKFKESESSVEQDEFRVQQCPASRCRGGTLRGKISALGLGTLWMPSRMGDTLLLLLCAYKGRERCSVID
jgi:hypothetical protein